MCDEAMLKKWAKPGLTRRSFGVAAGAAAITACAPPEGEDRSAAIELQEGAVQFATEDGTMDGFFVHPAQGKVPGVLFWPDIGGLREAKRKMARRLAGEGYAVLIANPYYRDVAGEQFTDFADFMANQGFQKARQWMARFNADAIMRDATAAIAWLDAQDAVDNSRGVGTQGYCMTGSFTMWSAAAVPDRVKALASFHGGGLVRPGDPMSPHRMFGRMQAASLIAIGQDDDAQTPQDKVSLREAADGAGLDARIEVYPADHGWCVPDNPTYQKDEADRAWAALLDLYRTEL